VVGGVLEGENFANRGDVIVRYADKPNNTVEMRRFTMAPTEALAQEDFEALAIWAYETSSSPKSPQQMDPADECRDPSGATPWRNGCQIRVYYEGLTQLARSGADLRVTLPAAWIGDLEVATEDNDGDADFHNRGNVCVEGLAGSANVTLGSGLAYVVLADEVTPAPTCPPDDVAACEVAGWDPNVCPCLNEAFAFGRTSIVTHDGSAADMVVDLPPDLWSAAFLLNQGPGQTMAASSNACSEGEGACCDAIVDASVGVYTMDASIGDESTRVPWRNQGTINFPGGPAVLGAGYNVRLESKACQSVTSTEDPEDFVGAGEGTTQETEERGNLELCAGCLRGTACEDLLPGSP
jgi:hypothetical protein